MSIYRMRTEFGHYLKWVLYVIVLIFVIGAIYSFSGGGGITDGGRQAEGGSDVVAKVNGAEITRNAFDSVWNTYQQRASEARIQSTLQFADMKAGVLQQMINSYLILSAAQQMGVDISDRKVDEQVEKVVVEFLKQNRESVLGKRKKYQAEDPRDDGEYKSELANAETSISQQEEMFRQRIPKDEIRAQIAREGITEKIKSEIKPVTDRDVTDSYNLYKVAQILLPKGGAPEEQLQTKANKIVSETKAGGDFNALAKTANADGPLSKTGGKAEYSWETRYMYPPEVREAIERLKPGEVTPAISTGFGIYIVKLENVAPKLPAKIDKKTMNARRKEIAQDREMAAGMAFGKRMSEKRKVQVLDPELQAYWQLSEAQQQYLNQAEYRKLRGLAIASLAKAVKERPNNILAKAKLAQLYNEDGQAAKAELILYGMLSGKEVLADTPDLWILLGDAQAKQNKSDKAVKSYQTASESARNDPNIHQQLMLKYKQLGRQDLVAAEQKWQADYDKRMAALKAMEVKNAPKPAPGAPSSPTR
ncbi:MAG: SurA N-terminal domain-containing protein [Armatimonadetes bacterium]|nr:SurA N-terminal domain-containing protein [Armatimonadota bacterium]